MLRASGEVTTLYVQALVLACNDEEQRSDSQMAFSNAHCIPALFKCYTDPRLERPHTLSLRPGARRIN